MDINCFGSELCPFGSTQGKRPNHAENIAIIAQINLLLQQVIFGPPDDAWINPT